MLGWVLASFVGTSPAVDIEWEAPEGCPDRAALVSELDAYLDRESQSVPDRIDTVQATIERSDTGWVLHLRAQVEGGVLERTLQADRCELLGSAAALMISVLVHPTAVVETIEQAQARAKSQTQTASSEAAKEHDAQLEPSPDAPDADLDPDNASQARGKDTSNAWTPSLRLGLEGGVGLGALPFGAEVQLQLGLSFDYLRAEVYGHFSAPRRLRFNDAQLDAAGISSSQSADRDRVGAQLVAWAIGGRACGLPGRERVRAPLCLGLEAGQFVANGVGLDEPRRATPRWIALSARAGVEVRIVPQLAFTLAAEALVPFARPVFSVPDVGDLHTTAPVGGRFTTGFAAEFSLAAHKK